SVALNEVDALAINAPDESAVVTWMVPGPNGIAGDASGVWVSSTAGKVYHVMMGQATPTFVTTGGQPARVVVIGSTVYAADGVNGNLYSFGTGGGSVTTTSLGSQPASA